MRIVRGIHGSAAVLAGAACRRRLRKPARSYTTKREAVSYPSGKAQVPALVVAPASAGSFPVAGYLHGRWGLTEEVAQYLDSIAEHGIVVFAPDYYFNRATPELAPFADNDAIADIEPIFAFIDGAKGRYTTRTDGKVGIIGQDHGGFFALQLSADKPGKIAVLLGIYGMFQDPTVSKTQHLYAYMPAVDELKTPTLLLIGSNDWEMRRLQNGRVVSRLEGLKTDARLIEYAGAQRWPTGASAAPASPRRRGRTPPTRS